MKIFDFINFYEIALWNSLKCQPNLEGEFCYILGPLAKIGISNSAQPLTFFNVKICENH